MKWEGLGLGRVVSLTGRGEMHAERNNLHYLHLRMTAELVVTSPETGASHQCRQLSEDVTSMCSSFQQSDKHARQH